MASLQKVSTGSDLFPPAHAASSSNHHAADTPFKQIFTAAKRPSTPASLAARATTVAKSIPCATPTSQKSDAAPAQPAANSKSSSNAKPRSKDSSDPTPDHDSNPDSTPGAKSDPSSDPSAKTPADLAADAPANRTTTAESTDKSSTPDPADIQYQLATPTPIATAAPVNQPSATASAAASPQIPVPPQAILDSAPPAAGKTSAAKSTTPSSSAQTPDSSSADVSPSDDSAPSTPALPASATPVSAHARTSSNPHNAPSDQQDSPSAPANPSPTPAVALPAPTPAADSTADVLASTLARLPDPADTHAPHAEVQPIVITADIQHAPATSANAASPAQDSPAIDPQHTLEQVILGLRGKIDAKNQSAEIHLEPQNLGPVHVSINVSNGILTADFQTGNPLVHDLLSSHLDKLRSVLEGQGITVDRLSVSANADKAAAVPPPSPQSQTRDAGTQNHDGRSAGNFGYRGQRPPPRNATGASSFAKALDLVA